MTECLCQWHTVNKFVQETCACFLYKFLVSSSRKFLYKKFSQQPQPTNQNSQFWSRVCKFLTHVLLGARNLYKKKLAPDLPSLATRLRAARAGACLAALVVGSPSGRPGLSTAPICQGAMEAVRRRLPTAGRSRPRFSSRSCGRNRRVEQKKEKELSGANRSTARKLRQTCKFLVQVDFYKILVQVSWLCHQH